MQPSSESRAAIRRMAAELGTRYEACGLTGQFRVGEIIADLAGSSALLFPLLPCARLLAAVCGGCASDGCAGLLLAQRLVEAVAKAAPSYGRRAPGRRVEP